MFSPDIIIAAPNLCSLTAAMLFFRYDSRCVAEIGGVELANRKGHIVKYLARIILVGSYTFLIGHRVFCGTDKVLCRSNDTHDGKDTYCHQKLSLGMISVAYTSLKACNYLVRNIVTTATAATAGITLVLLYDLC